MPHKGFSVAASMAKELAGTHSLRPKSWAFSDNPDVLIAQYANLKRQVPLLYLLLNIIALAGVYLTAGAAPLMIAGTVAGVFVIIGTIRMIWWIWFMPDPEDISAAQARTLLRRTTLAVLPICLSYLGYAFLLDAFGTPSQRTGVAICLLMTAIGCIFCLMHLPQAALTVNLTTMVPYTVYQLVIGNETFLVVALIASIVTTLMIRVSLNAHEAFIELVTSRSELRLRRREAERLAGENASLAMTDALTGLPNRRQFLALLEERVERCGQGGEDFVVGVLDLDRFKPVNDIHGHATGDHLLIQVGKRLQSVANDTVHIARLGGDEFGLLVDGNYAAAGAVGDKVIALLHEPFSIDGHELTLGCSIGFAASPYLGASASSIFDRADYALYDVKTDRRGTYGFFTPGLETRLRTQTELDATLLSADLASELEVELQPIICLDTLKVRGVEALARWNSTLIGRVEPTRFINAAERLNRMGDITTALFKKALDSAALLPDELGLSFNLSTCDIVTSSTIDKLIAMMRASDIAPERVTFEITETALLRDYDTAIKHVERLRAMGVAIALDDFGTGFSSLSYLSRLPIDKIKIDHSFVCKLTDPGVRKIVTAIISMSNTLNIKCIAEGVETLEDCYALRSMGCNKAQGYAIARPMNIAQLQAWLEDENALIKGNQLQGGLMALPALAKLHKRFPS